MAPVLRELAQRRLRPTILSTGQHPHLVRQALEVFGLAPDVELPAVETGIGLNELLARLMSSIGEFLAFRRPELVLVHGDTTSALAGALTATWSRVLVGHVEAGLRSGMRDDPFPEEMNRILIDRASDLWFAPTDQARDALIGEGCPEEVVFVTGNPVVDAVHFVSSQVARKRYADFPQLPIPPVGPWILVTSHRRESRGKVLAAFCEVVERLAASGVGVIWPVHRIPDVHNTVEAKLGAIPNVHLTPPLPYPAFVRLLLGASLILTDSGGVQEEAAVLGRPALILRAATERPEVLQSGVVRLVGTEMVEVERIARSWLSAPPTANVGLPLGDGRAAERIAAILERALG